MAEFEKKMTVMVCNPLTHESRMFYVGTKGWAPFTTSLWVSYRRAGAKESIEKDDRRLHLDFKCVCCEKTAKIKFQNSDHVRYASQNMVRCHRNFTSKALCVNCSHVFKLACERGESSKTTDSEVDVELFEDPVVEIEVLA
nr:cysteine-rich protein [Wheat yellow stripe virus]